jgi:adenylosuccinate lyase
MDGRPYPCRYRAIRRGLYGRPRQHGQHDGQDRHGTFELSRTEIAEIAEPWTYGNVGSSTMPQKRNPWGLETMIAISRSCTCHMANLYSTMSQIHERDFMSYYQEDYSISNICNMCECILHYGIKILGGLEVFPDRMLKNLDMTNGSVMLEHMMMVLTTKNVNRYEAHHKLYDYAIKAYRKTSRQNLIMQDKEMMAVMSLEELDEAFEYMSYVGICPEQVDAALDSASNGFGGASCAAFFYQSASSP